MAEVNRFQLPDTVKLIDVQHLGRAKAIGSYLLLGDQPALVDPGPASAVATLEAGLAAHGLRVEDLRALLLTHIHLDHAGATGTLARRNPQLRVYVHQLGAPHMIDPERLLRSATRLYGDQMGYLWGEFLPTPAEQVTALAGGERITLGRRSFDVTYAPGHASHHVIYHEPATGGLWVGDDAGLRMPGYTYVRPATPPPDIDLEGWQQTLDAMLALRPAFLALTHFGAYPDAERHIGELRDRLHTWSEVVCEGLRNGADDGEQSRRLEQHAASELNGAPASAHTLYAQAASVDQCWQGLARYWRKRLAAETTPD
jgi:glyoxylase-like metal-dependent hydrolase (beta-lactamase superfamily II)